MAHSDGCLAAFRMAAQPSLHGCMAAQPRLHGCTVEPATTPLPLQSKGLLRLSPLNPKPYPLLLQSSSLLRQIYDLSNLERSEDPGTSTAAAAAAGAAPFK